MKILQTAIDTYYADTKGKQPKCFTKKEYNAWVKHEDLAHTEPRKFPCRDCTVQYQRDMSAAGKCHIADIPVAKIAR